eukprot:m.58439 g.58439  ORF g.58439 m.58439 type:complete len:733 (-) comp6901_c0_seq1:1330-3528(-)
MRWGEGGTAPLCAVLVLLALVLSLHSHKHAVVSAFLELSVAEEKWLHTLKRLEGGFMSPYAHVAQMQARLLERNQQSLLGLDPNVLSRCDSQPASPSSGAMLPVYLYVVSPAPVALHGLWGALAQSYSVATVRADTRLHAIRLSTNSSRGYASTMLDGEHVARRLRMLLRRGGFRGRQLIVDNANALPSGFGHSSLALPDLAYLAHLDGRLFHLRVLVVADSTAPLPGYLIQWGCNDFRAPHYRARMAAAAMRLTRNRLARRPCGTVLHVARDELLRRHPPAMAALARLLGVDVRAVDLAVAAIVPHTAPVEPQSDARMAALGTLENLLSPLPRLNELPDAWPLQLPRWQREALAPSDIELGARYLLVDWQLHLGFNNVLYILQLGAHLAALLGRRLAYADALRMRRCHNVTLCAKSTCRLSGAEYLCPLATFVDERALEHAGVRLFPSADDLTRRLQSFEDKSAFEEIYGENVIAVDSIAAALGPMWNQSGIRSNFTYYTQHFSCELIVKGVDTHTWVWPEPVTNTSKQLFGFVDRYGNLTEELLVLRGAPHRIGRAPVYSTARARIDDQQRLQRLFRTYNANIIGHARLLSGLLLGRTGAASFVCMHLRRDDFTDLGWNTRGLDMDRVRRRIERARRPGEALYIATDEEDPARLADLRAEGALFWRDFEAAMYSQHIPDIAMLGFTDYVGLVEQQVCAGARAFLGSQCSSFSGTIVSMRRDARLANHDPE